MVDFSNILPNVLVFIDDYVYLNNFYYLDNAYFSYAIFNVQCSSVIRTCALLALPLRQADSGYTPQNAEKRIDKRHTH